MLSFKYDEQQTKTNGQGTKGSQEIKENVGT